MQKPHPPVWFGGNAPAGMRRAARHGDEWAGSQTTSRYAKQVAMVKEELAVLDRDRGSFKFGKRVYVQVDDDPAVAKKRLEEALKRHYGGGDWSEHMVAGTA